MPRTFYEHDGAGRLVSSWTESEWDEDQVDLLLAEEIVRRNTGDLGEWLPDATSDDADPMTYSGLRYTIDGPHTNWAQKEHMDAMQALKKSDANVNGQFYTVKAIDKRDT